MVRQVLKNMGVNGLQMVCVEPSAEGRDVKLSNPISNKVGLAPTLLSLFFGDPILFIAHSA